MFNERMLLTAEYESVTDRIFGLIDDLRVLDLLRTHIPPYKRWQLIVCET
jgi:hypothetical protein